MFGRKHQGARRPIKIVFVIFRLMLSLAIFAVLLGGIYSAFKHLSGMDPLKLNPQAILKEVLSGRVPREFLSLSNQINQKILPADKQILGEGSAVQKLTPILTFAIVSDSHNDNQNLSKALMQAKQYNPAFVIGLGDYTDVGILKELGDAKQQFDSTALRYFLVAGDHDLWDSRDKSLSPNANFRQVFGPLYQSFEMNNFKFILLFNSDNYLGVDEEQFRWLLAEIDNAKQNNIKAVYVFLHVPLYHPSSDHVMGRVEAKLKDQAKNLITTLKDGGVREVFAGDTHYFSYYEEGERHLPMVTVGAVTSERSPQAPRFAMVYIFDDGSTKVDDIEVK